MNDGSAPFRKYGQATCWGSRKLRNKKTPISGLVQRRKRRTRPPNLQLGPHLSGSLTKSFLGEIIMAELTIKNSLEDHQVVSSAEWLAARKELLRKEKEFTRQRDQ